jgi:hypothetical protein
LPNACVTVTGKEPDGAVLLSAETVGPVAQAEIPNATAARRGIRNLVVVRTRNRPLGREVR